MTDTIHRDLFHLGKMLERQRRQQRNWHPSETSLAERQRILNDLLLGLHSEVGELQRLLHDGYHILRRREVKMASVTHELVDVLKYVLALAATLGVESDELVETFWRVSDAVDDRWRCEQAELSGERVLGVDIDDCLADFTGGFRRWFESQPISAAFDAGQINAAWMEPHKQRFYASGGFLELEPLPGAVSVVRDWKAKGVRIVVVTARPKQRHKNVETDTIVWLRRHNIPYDLLVFERDKAEALCEYVLPAEVIGFVEDRHKHAIEVAALDVPVYLMRGKADASMSVPDHPMIRPVDSWAEVNAALRRAD